MGDCKRIGKAEDLSLVSAYKRSQLCKSGPHVSVKEQGTMFSVGAANTVRALGDSVS